MKGFFNKLKEKAVSIVNKTVQSAKKKPNPSTSFKLPEVNFERALSKLFSPELRPAIHKSLLIAITASSTYYTGKFIGSALDQKFSKGKKNPLSRQSLPLNSRSKLRESIASIKKSNLFNARMSDTSPFQDKVPTKRKNIEGIVCRHSTSKSNLPIKLLNTIVLQDSVKSMASVTVRGKKNFFHVREGEKIQSLAQVGKINSQIIVLKNLSNGDCEFIKAKTPKSKSLKNPIKVASKKEAKKLISKNSLGIKNEGNHFKIKKKVREEMLSNMSEVITQARAIKIVNADGTLSFKMTEIVPGSLYSKLDVQNGDIIDAINGKKFRNMNDLMTLFGQLSSIDKFSILSRRNGTPQTKNYDFE